MRALHAGQSRIGSLGLAIVESSMATDADALRAVADASPRAAASLGFLSSPPLSTESPSVSIAMISVRSGTITCALQSGQVPTLPANLLCTRSTCPLGQVT